MGKTLGRLAACFSVLVLAASPASAADQAPAKDANTKTPSAKHTLRYKFRPGEQLKWTVDQRVSVETTVSGNTQTAEMATTSTKVWRIKDVGADGSTTFENLAEGIVLRQKLSGRAEIQYNSKTDKQPPLGFENMAQSIGIPLSRITIDAQGKLLKREHLAGATPDGQGQVTLPLPEQPIAIGESWKLPFDLDVPQKDGTFKKIKTQQSFTLEEVKDNVATIRIETQILTPIHDPAIEAQIMQRETTGKVRFDIAAGRVLSQETDVDKQVLGFSGAASSCQYKTRVTETLQSGETKTAEAPKPAATETKTADAPKPAPTEPKAAETKTAEAPKPAKSEPQAPSLTGPALPEKKPAKAESKPDNTRR